MDWRREDTGYATATVGVVAFVAYLLAANFGLVPSPLAPLQAGRPSSTLAIQAPPDISTSVTAPMPPPVTAVDRPSASHPPAIDGGTDMARPAVTTSTKDGTAIGLTSAPTVSGVAGDVGTGIDKVLVSFETSSGREVVPADVTCSADRHRCTWSAKVPSVLATYAITAKAVDRAGNAAESAPIHMTVINTGGTVEQVGETVGRVPDALVKAVNGLLGLLSPRP